MKKRKILAGFLIVFTVMLSSFTFYGYQMLFTPNVQVGASEPQILHIARGTTFKQLQKKLDKAHVVNDLVTFSFLAKILGYHREVHPGHYTLNPDMGNLETIKFLRRGNPPVRIQIQGLRTLSDLYRLLDYTFYLDSAKWGQFFADEDNYLSYGFDKENIIGIFIPDTYEFYYKVEPQEFLAKTKKQYDFFWNTHRKDKASKLGLTPQEVTTLASIVQGETAQLKEAPTIAGVYLNRLARDMPLQADPTLKFANQNFEVQRIRHGDKAIDSPYNTYKYKGLPPGPINLPDRGYVEAVLNAERHDFLFFCAKSDFSGYHIFSERFSEHLVNARKFQRALNKRGIER